MLAAEKLRELRALMGRTNERLLPLRQLLGKTEKGAAAAELPGRPLQAFLVDTADAHQSEYVGAAHKRREFLTGFTGSSGTALVTPDRALMWTDGRYFLQAERELSGDWTLMRSEELGVPTIEQWASKNLPADSCLGIDPYLTSVLAARTLAKALKETRMELVALHGAENLVDLVWKDRPVAEPSRVTFLSDEYTGRSVADKLRGLREAVKDKAADAVVLTALDDIAWLFNIRGNDVEFNPVVCVAPQSPRVLVAEGTSYAVVTLDSATLFVDAANQDDVDQHLGPSGVACKPYSSMLQEVSAFTATNKDKKILVDPTQCNVAVFLAIPAANRKEETSVVMAQKAIKSAVEIEGMRQAHLRDGAALVKYFSWLEKEMDAGREDQWDEVLVADKQEQLRQQAKDYVSLSFDTISSIGANGSIIHYSPKRGECAKMSTSAMYLNDSGAQYLDGTTDVTRTLHFGQPSAYEKACFTHVLKAHIALATAVFPDKTEGVRLDAITRAPLWKAGLDYRHGTGHGVGAFLNVHEKGVLLSFRLNPNGLKIQDGMILSNEPGYYEDGKFGIRIESVMVAKKAPHVKSPLNREFCEFETLTMAPIQQKLIDVSLLTPDEIKWLNAYHTDVHDKLQPLLKDDPETYTYLVRETKPLPLP
ncbi:Xaa-Pro aminopeptidase 2 [Phytophthora pseudosyringae]|uniref:Xaa-Pro aminopeptidase 2 n=1 Tax=Phytophthora pseudosyringae TaxID=221518 RepID=A0A8T1VPF7_9STRA|nr:Xaa-Pro aminopeptidase 2 [Phytophthora pseudosyringae]